MSNMKRFLSVFLAITMVFTTLLSTGMIAQAATIETEDVASMLPLEEVNAYLVLNGKTDEELANLSLDEMLGMLVDSDGTPISISSDATTVWRHVKSEEDNLEEYRQYNIGQNESIDLSVESGIKAYTVELIVGSANQLDNNNIRYIIKVYVTNTIQEEISYELYLQDSSGNRSKVLPERTVSAVNTQLFEITANEWSVQEPENGSQYYLNVSSLVNEHPNVRTEVYRFWDYAFSSVNATPITSIVLDQNMQQSGSGLPIGYGSANAEMLALVYFDKDERIIGQSFVSFAAVKDTSYIEARLYQKNNSEYTDIVMFDADHIGFDDVDSIFAGAGVHELCLMLKDGYSVESDIYCVLNAHGSTYGDAANSYVSKAVVGHYDTLDAAAGCVDIKEQLIPADKTSTTRGYKADYSYKNGGTPFTIFFEDGSVWKVLVLAMEYEPQYDESYVRTFTDKPIIGEADPWIRVTGASDVNGYEYDTYVIENGKNINMDTYYGYGYQTIFINDSNADLSSIKPEFWYVNTERVYAVDENTGDRIDTEHIRDFSKENQQYAGIIIDKSNQQNEKNYWVTFKKLNNSGSELFVYGPSEREVILDEYFEFKHDILIANIGNAPLEDISVELLDAENVKLDPYWTVGGKGNDTLAAFTTTSTNTKYGTLANLAKIRLLPDGDGEVKGTLVIRAKNQEPVMITLNGTAQNPEIITKTLDDAVKYVPYQHIIATNNMHDWVDTKFRVSAGSLPEGITLNSETGEIYGVPTVPDGDTEATYKFTVEAKYLVDGQEGYFDASYKEYELLVKPNTDKNVYEASDENNESTNLDDGYTIKQHIGTKTDEYRYELDVLGNTIFTSYGQYKEFVKLWLNGVELKLDTDYKKEEGSTKITIKGQTMENNVDPNGRNTIAMEFRKDNDGDGKGDDGAEMNRTSQNFYVKQETSVDKVIAKINALPAKITLNDKSAVQSARNAYNALSSSEKSQVTNYGKLTAAENTIAQLEEEAANQAAANKVIEKINNIPSLINFDAKDEIDVARTAYNALTSAQKKLVTNYGRLTDAEAALKKYEEQQSDKAAANKVVSLISAIPASITSDAKDEIQAARTAYNALTSAQKEYVTNYDRLTAAEAALKQYEEQQAEIEKDKEAANKVVQLINKLPSKITLDDKDAVNSARNAYNALTSSQKGYVTNYSKLTAAEEKIVELENEAKEQAKINAVISAIDSIPEELTLKDKSTVEAARKAYDALTPAQKYKVVNYSDLTNAEDTIAALEAQENANKADKEAADKVIKLIDDIPETVTLKDKSTVETVRKAYDKLTDKQKKLVTNYSDLTDAEATIKSLEEYEAAAKKDKEAADVVIKLIEAIPTNVTLEDKSTIETARKAYDALTDSQKSIVTNYDVLTTAEVKIAELENDDYKEVQSVTFVGILVDKNGKALFDTTVEIHSVIQTGKTDENGSFQFNDVEFGKHTIFIKDENGNVTSKRDFNIVLGSPLSINGDEIVAENGTVFTVKMQLDNGELTFMNVEEGNKAPVVDTNKDDDNSGVDIGEDKTPEVNKGEDGIDIGDDSKVEVPSTGNNNSSQTGNINVPQTGDRRNVTIWYILLVMSLSVLIVMGGYELNNRRYKHKR